MPLPASLASLGAQAAPVPAPRPPRRDATAVDRYWRARDDAEADAAAARALARCSRNSAQSGESGERTERAGQQGSAAVRRGLIEAQGVMREDRAPKGAGMSETRAMSLWQQQQQQKQLQQTQPAQDMQQTTKTQKAEAAAV